MTPIRILAGAGLLGVSLAACARQQSPEPTETTPPQAQAGDEAAQRAQMRREVEEAAQAIGAYSAARRDEALGRARTAMDDMDRRIRRFEADWHAGARRIGEASKTAREKEMEDIRRRREELGASYRALQESNEQAWDRTRERFVEAYRRLAEALGMNRAQPGIEDDLKPGNPEEEPDEPGAEKENERAPR